MFDGQQDDSKLLLSSEKQFLLRDAYNRGFTQLPRMVGDCIDLSDGALRLYNAIMGYIFEHGRSAFPSLETLGLKCGCHKRRVIERLKELTDKGFIVKVRRGAMKTNDYYLVDLDKVPHLRVSEMFHHARSKFDSSSGDKLSATLEIIDHFKKQGIKFNDIEVSSGMEKKLEQLYAERLGGKDMNPYAKKPKSIPVAVADGDTVNIAEKDHWSSMDVSAWKKKHFLSYFLHRYEKATDTTFSIAPSNRKAHGMMANCIKRVDADAAKLKAHIDAFFDIGYDIPSLEFFAGTGRVPELDAFITKGVRPYYLVQKQKAAATEVEKESVSKSIEQSETSVERFKELLGL
jgi:biotin operon repressor